MSEAGEPEAGEPDTDPRDWFRGRPPEAARTPRPVAEAAMPDSEPALESRLQPAPAPAADPALTDAGNTAADADQSATSDAPTPADDGRVRLRALTGGLADLSDALAAIGVESVALRSAAPTRPSAPAPVAPTSAADFRVRCPDCGPQFVAIADVRFVETGDSAEANRYLFTCPACGARVRRPAGPELAEILKSAGVATLALRRGPGQAL